MSSSKTVQLGFAVPSGESVEIPIAHTFVTGQTQLSGKTTTLRAIVERSERKALAFVTKRGEDFAGRRVRPYLPREGEKQIPWRLVETIMAASLGQRNMKWERGAIVTASKGATTLQQVRTNVSRLQAKTKNAKTEELYMLLGEYLDLVLPEMAALGAASTLEIEPGLNVMDLAGVGTQTQAMVIRAALEHINAHEHGVLTVFPEAWEFAPRGRGSPAKDEAIAMARKGAVLQNFLLCDSQDIAGVDTVVRQAASVWILGVQRELNELKRTIQMIPAGIKRPKPEEVATLELGQFYACWGRNAIKAYVQPTWVSAEEARLVAMGKVDHKPAPPTRRVKEDAVTERKAQELRDENARLKKANEELQARLDALEKRLPADPAPRAPVPTSSKPAVDETKPAPRTFTADESLDNERLYQAFKARLIDELPSDPAVMRIVVSRPELQVQVRRNVLEIDGDTLRGRIARLMTDGFFDEPAAPGAVIAELIRRGAGADVKFNVSKELQALTAMGFFFREGKTSQTRYQAVPGMKVNVVEAA